MPAAPPERVPVSSYRLQLHSGFGFQDVARLAPYLASIGITELFLSPILAAKPGSLHGYDTGDPSRLNPELGTPEDFERLTETRRRQDMGLILDFVPNHMSNDPEANSWWKDVLESGPSSPYARFFDIDWDPVKHELRGKVLLPILGDQYGTVLENGQLRVQLDEQGDFSVHYGDRRLPLNIRQTQRILRHDLGALESALPPEDPCLREYLSILFHLEHMPAYTETAPEMVSDRFREKEVARERLVRLMRESEAIRRHVRNNVRRFNGKPGDAASFDLLHDLLEAQAYRLSYWRAALHEINFRRFFDINELAAIRMEDPEVFEATHGFLLELMRQGAITGLRLDHIDGLFDPGAYFERLHTACGSCRGIYVVGEKILSAGEPLRTDWPIHGTTGYDFLNDLNGLFVNSQNAQVFRKLYARFTGQEDLFADVAYESRKLIIMGSMVSELNMLARELNRISERNRRLRDFTLSSLQEALREVVACFPVYRTYCTADGWDEFDRRTIETAVSRALRRNPAMEASIFEFIRQALLPTPGSILPPPEHDRVVRFAMKFQQYTGPVQAKGLEDTAFYRYTALLSLNEVGGDPARFGRSPEEFHEANARRLRHWPLAMLATSTHDSKRGEDARARLNVLSEMPNEWRAMLFRWARINAGMRTLVDGEPAPDRADEYMFYQALLGAWPAGLGKPDAEPNEEPDEEPDAEFAERMRRFMMKAIHEEKARTSWINPVQSYDNAAAEFVRRTLVGSHARRFLRSFAPFAERIAELGVLNSLAQVVFKVASPGVPDFYQGVELWDVNLVDPDNRRPVDYQKREALLSSLGALLEDSAGAPEKIVAVQKLLTDWRSGLIKFYVTVAALRLRGKKPKLFLEGDYVPLAFGGKNREHLVGFARVGSREAALAIAPRFVAGLPRSETSAPFSAGLWRETAVLLPAAVASMPWRNIFTGERVAASVAVESLQIPASEVLKSFPVALLTAEI